MRYYRLSVYKMIAEWVCEIETGGLHSTLFSGTCHLSQEIRTAVVSSSGDSEIMSVNERVRQARQADKVTIPIYVFVTQHVCCPPREIYCKVLCQTFNTPQACCIKEKKIHSFLLLREKYNINICSSNFGLV
jgi:hypothetical protein